MTAALSLRNPLGKSFFEKKILLMRRELENRFSRILSRTPFSVFEIFRKSLPGRAGPARAVPGLGLGWAGQNCQKSSKMSISGHLIFSILKKWPGITAALSLRNPLGGSFWGKFSPHATGTWKIDFSRILGKFFKIGEIRCAEMLIVDDF